MIYLDNSATTRPCPEAVAAVREALTDFWANPSSLYRPGAETRRRLEQSRQEVAAAIGAEAKRVFFTSGGTESDNWAISSAARRLGKRGRHIVTTSVEHHAVLGPLKRLEEDGFTVTCLPPNPDGTVTAEALQNALREDTILVSVMLVNNESGAVMPIERMAAITHRLCPNALFHTDAVQGLFKVPFHARSLGADLISVSGHKVAGPKGVGALYIRPGLPFPPLLPGGGQEQDFRSGTEAVPAILGFGAACRVRMGRVREEIAHMTRLRDLCRDALSHIPGVVLLGEGTAPHIIGFSVPGHRSQELINRLQDREIYVSAGSACAKGRRSHVWKAMGLSNEIIDGAVRVSLCPDNTEADVLALERAIREDFSRGGAS